MKIIFALWLAFLMALSDVIHAADAPGAMASPHYKQALRYVPKGADIIEIIETRENTVMYKGLYIKFDLNGACYMIYRGNYHFGLTMDGCG